MQDEEAKEVIERCLDMISAVAWKGYQEKGKGAVIVERLHDDEQVRAGMMRYDSVAELGPEPEDDPGAPHGMCERYDPSTQAVVVVFGKGPDGMYHTFAARIGPGQAGGLEPPEAYEKFQHRLENGGPMHDQFWNN